MLFSDGVGSSSFISVVIWSHNGIMNESLIGTQFHTNLCLSLMKLRPNIQHSHFGYTLHFDIGYSVFIIRNSLED